MIMIMTYDYDYDFGASAPLFLRNGDLLGHSPIRNIIIQSNLSIWSPLLSSHLY